MEVQDLALEVSQLKAEFQNEISSMKEDITQLNGTLVNLNTTLQQFCGKLDLIKDNISPRALFYGVLILLLAFGGIESMKALLAYAGLHP